MAEQLLKTLIFDHGAVLHVNEQKLQSDGMDLIVTDWNDIVIYEGNDWNEVAALLGAS